MEQRGLKVLETDKTFFSKITNTLTKLLIPTKVGINGMLISIKRNNALKAYEGYEESNKVEDTDKKETASKKYEEVYALYLESIDKYIMDSIYKKVKNGTASPFESNALSKYYGVIHLKETQYIEYKHVKQKFLLELDYETVHELNKEKLQTRYDNFYANKMDSLYKGLLKHYSIQLADNQNVGYAEREQIYNKIFMILEQYIVEILPIKMKNDTTGVYKNIIEEYDKFEKYTVGKLDQKDYIEKNMLLLAISRQLFTHSLPLVVAEQCYVKLLKDTRSLIVDTKVLAKREKAYSLLINLIEDYNIRLLSTKIYWDNPEARNEYRTFWDEYKAIDALKETDFINYMKQKEILFIRNDLKQIQKSKRDYSKITKFYKDKLVEFGVMKRLKNSCKTEGNYTKKRIKENV